MYRSTAFFCLVFISLSARTENIGTLSNIDMPDISETIGAYRLVNDANTNNSLSCRDTLYINQAVSFPPPFYTHGGWDYTDTTPISNIRFSPEPPDGYQSDYSGAVDFYKPNQKPYAVVTAFDRKTDSILFPTGTVPVPAAIREDKEVIEQTKDNQIIFRKNSTFKNLSGFRKTTSISTFTAIAQQGSLVITTKFVDHLSKPKREGNKKCQYEKL